MKRIIFSILFLSIIGTITVGCATTKSPYQNYTVSKVDEYSSAPQEVTFKRKEYTLNFSYEFNEDLSSENLAHMSWTMESWNAMFPWLSKSENIASEVNLEENHFVKDGALHLIEHHYVDEDGVYHQNYSEVYGVNRRWFDWQNILQNPYTCNKGLYEIKFKMPKVKGVSFAIFLVSAKDTDEVPVESITSTGYFFDEVDFAELKSFGNKVKPIGGVHVIDTKTNEKVSHGYEYNMETFNKELYCSEEWFDEWHILQVVWEDYNMEIYYDGKLFRKVNILKKWGEASGDYGFIIRPEPCDYPWDPNPVNWSDTERHDFQIDYVRVYTAK